MGVRVVFPDMGKDPSIQLIEKTITENGTYDAITDGANGYSKVNVNVEGGGGSSDFSTAEVTLNLTVEGKTVTETSLETVMVEYPNEDFSYSCGHNPSINNKCSVLLYQGHATAGSVMATTNDYLEYSTIIGTPVTSGGVNWNSELGLLEITGDGAISAVLSK